MNSFTIALAQSAIEAFEIADPIVEIGSLKYDITGQDVDLRPLFPGHSYVGCDIAAGPGVDRIEDITKLTFKDAEVGTLICFHILEHVWDIFAAFKHIRRVVKEGGLALVVCPFDLHIHRFPKDYWRFTDDSFRELMRDFPWLILGRHGYANMPADVFGIGFARSSFPDFDQRYEKFKQLLERKSFDPSTLAYRLRMRIGATLFRKKHFQSFLRRNDLALEVLRPPKGS